MDAPTDVREGAGEGAQDPVEGEAQDEGMEPEEKARENESKSDSKSESKSKPESESKAEGQDDQSAEEAAAQAEKEAKGALLAQMWESDLQGIVDSTDMRVCVCAIDLQSNKRVSLGGSEQVPSASMIKLLVAETFFRQVADGKQSLDDVYELRGSDMVGGTGVINQMAPGTPLDMQTLLTHMIADSDNTATNVLIDRLGMDAINTEAEALGLKQTRLQRRMMDFGAAESGFENYTSANDVAKLLKMVYKRKFVNKKSSKLMLQMLERQTDNTCISAGLPDGTVFAHKTGSGSTVRHDGGIVEGDRPFVLVCLCGDGGGYSEYLAMSTMQRIGAAAYADAEAVYPAE